MTTPITTQHSGPSLAGSQSPAESDDGDIYGIVCDQVHWLLTRKREYYGCPDEDPLANAQAVAEDGIWPVTYQMARISEKLRRMRALTRSQLKRQIRDTVFDIAGHAIVAIALLDKEVAEEKPEQ